MNIEEEITKIKERNNKVECEKAWETSKTRKSVIAITTYLVMVCIMYVLKLENPLIGAIIPTIGFVLSTISVSLIKSIWIKKFYK